MTPLGNNTEGWDDHLDVLKYEIPHNLKNVLFMSAGNDIEKSVEIISKALCTVAARMIRTIGQKKHDQWFDNEYINNKKETCKPFITDLQKSSSSVFFEINKRQYVKRTKFARLTVEKENLAADRKNKKKRYEGP